MHNTKQLCQKAYNKDPEFLFDICSSISSGIIDSPFEIRQIKSASIFPEIVNDNDKHILHWDIQYWELFDRFVLELSNLLETRMYQNNVINKLCALFFDYLSLKLSRFPALSYCIQVNRERRYGADDYLSTVKLFDSVYESTIFIARTLVYYHELFHQYYKINPKQKIADLEMLHRMADIYLKGNWDTLDKENEEILILFEGLHTLQTTKQNKLMEEAMCDYRALIETVTVFPKINYTSNRKVDKNICEIHDAFHISQTFLSILFNISSCWEAVYMAYKSSDNSKEFMRIIQPLLDDTLHMATIRNLIIPDFLDRIVMKKNDIESYTNILDRANIHTILEQVSDKIIDINFMIYAIEESLRIERQEHYNPFEMKNIVLSNARYM